ncbi:hypothetical protein D5F11_021625 [Siminovitchia terrae]|uniref:Uncharacterized protein n=1 Tax=Siminovitchia terrae TaxID=1914933 RepID=A0A429X2K9_SIMTE|nr:hypothetical protein [Siminovitchia terrae]RST57663.1 hypothetical protein D5F11_021625 [Siminovitchia terrae]
MQQINQGLRGRVGVSDVERLEETQEHLVAIKNLVDKYENCYDKDIALKYCRDLMRYHAKWFIQQAERVEEQQKEIERSGKWKKHAESLSDVVSDLELENKRYREALEKAVKIMQDHAIGDAQAEVDMMYFVEEWKSLKE